jgi:LysR family transcriptional regulator for metE and metH
MLELRHLRLVEAIAEEGGVTRAGRRLHLTPSALSHQLRDVEERLGVRLFERIGKRMLLAAAGARLLQCAKGVLSEVERAEQEIRLAAQGERGLLRLTTQCNTVYHWLPSRLTLFQRRDPQVEVQVVAGATDDPCAALLEGRIDLAIVHRPSRDPRLLLRPLFKDEVVIVMPPGHRLAGQSFVSPADLAPEHLIVYSIPRESNLVFRKVLIPAGVTPARVTHIQLTEAIVELVKAGLGVTALPRWSVAPQVERRELVARSLTSPGLFRQWSAAYRRRPAPPGHLLRFVELLAKHPLPLGRTARERRALEALVAAPP